MKFEEEIEFPVSLKEIWDFSNDFRQWPMWYSGMLEVVDPEKGAWSKPGDSVRVAYKLLGRRIEYTCTLSEFKEYELLDFVAEPPVLPAAHFRWHWSSLGEGRAKLTVELETDEPTSFFGKVIEKTQVPRVYHKDMARSLANLKEIAEVGIPQ